MRALIWLALALVLLIGRALAPTPPAPGPVHVIEPEIARRVG